MTRQMKALSVHLLTATGAVFAMLAMLAAVDGKWDLMFLWLVVAFFVDGIDGPLARKYDVKTNASEFDGVLLAKRQNWEYPRWTMVPTGRLPLTIACLGSPVLVMG